MMEYFGSNLDRKAYEMRSLKIDPMHREGEADLIRSRWFDYARLLPAQATYLFAHHYQEQARRWCVAHVDARTAEEARPFTPDDIFMSRDMTAMWLARRCADAHGIPYDFALHFAQDRALNRLHHRFPRPNQLYGEEFELDLADAWKASLQWSIRYSKELQFRASNYTGSPNQVRHVAFVIGQLKSRQAPHHNTLGRMFNEDVLNPALAAQAFAPEVISLAESVAAKLNAQS